MSTSDRRIDTGDSPQVAVEQAMALLSESGRQLLIDSEAMAQAVYLYNPVFDPEGQHIIDLEIVLLNDAARDIPLAAHIVEGVRASDVFVDAELASQAADVAWHGGKATTYEIERRGVQNGQHMVVRYEVSTFRVGSYIVQVSVDHTSMSQLATADTRFRLMAEASSEGLLLLALDPEIDQYVVVYANPSALKNDPTVILGEPLTAESAAFVRAAISELRIGAPVRRVVQRDILARHTTLEVTFTHVDVGQVMLAARELTSEEAAREELDRSGRVLQAIGVGAFGTIAVFEPRFAGGEVVELALLWSAAGQGRASARDSDEVPLDPTTVLPADELLQIARDMMTNGETKRAGWVPIASGSAAERSVEFTLVLAGDRFVLEFVERTDELAVRTALAMVTAAAEAQRSFLSRVSHELRSPLNVIHGYSQLLGRMQLPGGANAHVERIESGVHRMVQIVDDLLLLGQLDQGLVRVDEHPLDLRDLTTDVLASAATQPWFVPGCLLPIAGGSTATVRTDRLRFGAVLLLVAEASRKSASSAVLEVGPYVRGTRAGLQLLAPATSTLVDAVWRPFVSGHSIPGAGLGLAVARGLCNVLGISVEVRDGAPEASSVALVFLLNPVT